MPSFDAVLDTYYTYVYTKMQTINSSRLFGGVINAADWPQTPVQDSTLYLIFINAVPVNAQRDGSQAEMLYEHFCQWMWLIRGTDIGATQQVANRGDRYRTHLQIMADLRNTNYPGFCPKISASADTQGNVTLAPVTGQWGGGPESVWWARLRFPTRSDNQKSGLVYGTAPVEVYGFISVPLSIA